MKTKDLKGGLLHLVDELNTECKNIEITLTHIEDENYKHYYRGKQHEKFSVIKRIKTLVAKYENGVIK